MGSRDRKNPSSTSKLIVEEGDMGSVSRVEKTCGIEEAVGEGEERGSEERKSKGGDQ